MHDFQKEFQLFLDNPVTNWHEHVAVGAVGNVENDKRLKLLIEDAKLTGMDSIVISRPIAGGHHALPEQIERANDTVAEACRLYPETLYGLCYTDAVHGRFAVQEIDRCRREHGMIGVKLYNQFHMSDDIQNGIIEYTIEHGMCILMHAGRTTQIPDTQKNISDSTHMRAAAKKYPDARFIMAHIGGGGDWNWQLRGMEDCPNVFCDISGSVFDAGMIEGLVRVMGAERVLFGTDGSFSSSIGKLCAAKLTVDEKKTILHNPTFAQYLKGGK